MPGELKLMDCTSSGAALTLKLCVTVGAAAVLLLPAWLASSVQVPAATSAKLVPPTVQTPGVAEAKLTTRPDVALATKGAGAVPSVWLPGELNVMSCEAPLTVKVRTTALAAAKLLLPGWLAVTVQAPIATSDKAVPLTVQTPVVDDTRVTAKPDVAVATRAGGAVPSVWLPGDAKVIDCGAATTAKVFNTVAAAAKVLLPAWSAVTVQVPAACRFKVVPTTVHTAGVVDTSVTGKAEVEVADSAAGAVPSVWLPGELKLMVCGAARTLIVRTTAGAAA